jgi:predicted enzyme related to lactoylglutathione lyase
MTKRDVTPVGAPCWTDLWTSDVESSRRFYCELFGWEAQEPSPEFGGYFMFTREGAPVAGGMGDMGEFAADNAWKIYLDTDDIKQVVREGEAAGAQIMVPPVPVADMGIQTVLMDSTGATLGAWQAGTFPGFQVLDVHGTPSWFELYARDYAAAVSFYQAVFRLDVQSVADSDEFRYSVLRAEGGDVELGGIMDSGSSLAEGVPSHWVTYWEVDDIDAALAKVRALGGSVTSEAADSPHGRVAGVADPAGAQFKLRTGPS